VALDHAPKGVGRLVDQAIELYRAEFRTVAVPAAILLLPLSLLVTLAQNQVTSAVTRSIAAAETAPSPVTLFATLGAAYSLLFVTATAIGLGLLYYESCLLQAVPQLLDRQPVAPGAFLKGGWRRLGHLLLAVFVAGLMGGIGYLFFLVPGILLVVYLSLVREITVLERAHLGDAISRSFSLVSGNFWRVVGFFLASFTVIYALQSAFTSLAVVPTFLNQIAGGANAAPVPALPWQVFTGVMQGLAYAISVPLQGLCGLMLYLDLRSRREGMDLIMRAEALTARAS
jgi:hypothetical protein